MIIDCHCHAGKGDLLTAPWNTDAALGPYLRRARQAGIDKTIVFPAFNSDYATANAQLARLIPKYAGRLIGFAFIHALRDAGRIFQMVQQAVTQWGFRGIKIHGHDAMPTREVCEAAKAFGVPVLVDVAGQTAVIEMFAPQYREVNFIIPHLGSFADDWRAHQQLIDQLVRHPNIYADTSGVRRFDYLVEAIKRAGARKLLFGSDGPWLHPALELQKIRLLSLPSDQEAMILGGNILRLLSRQSRASLYAYPRNSALDLRLQRAANVRPNGARRPRRSALGVRHVREPAVAAEQRLEPAACRGIPRCIKLLPQHRGNRARTAQ